MLPPEGLNVTKNLVCKLKKTLYGLKQALMEWNKRFDDFIKGLGFQQCNSDRCLYVLRRSGQEMYLLLYVDDCLIVANNRDIMSKT